MNTQVRIRELVERALDSGCEPEEVCKETPELLEDVRSLWSRFQLVRDQVEALFPAGGSLPPDTQAQSLSPERMPRIPGLDVCAVIGRGGAGVVYRARQSRLDRDVAVKMLLSGEYASGQELARFLLEAQAEASLRHPNIVQVHDVGECEGRPYFTMEFVEGGNLSERLAGKPETPAAAAVLLATLAEAVQVAHEGGLVHRDLKPSNVLLTADGTPKISDFGLARRIQGGPSVTASGLVLGTPSYMAPEQVQGSAGAIGPAVDIYALGAILYELLTGRPPFRAESALATQMQVVSQDPVPPSRLNAQVPRDLETICMKCLEKEPRRRYASAAALAADLQHFLRGEPISARQTGPFERAVKWVQRRPAQAAMLAGSALAVLALASAGIWIGLRKAATERAAEEDLQDVARRERSGEWPEARANLERARLRLGESGPLPLRSRLDSASRELDLVARLDAIRLDRATVDEEQSDLEFNKAKADREYAAAFQEAGMGSLDEDPAIVAARIRGSNIQGAAVAGLDDWAEFASEVSEPRRLPWLLAVARRAAPDPTGWRDRARDPATWSDVSALAELADSAVVSQASVPLLVAMGERLTAKGGNSVAFLRKVQAECPQDFWANFALGNALVTSAPEQAVECFRAAHALRPGAVAALFDLGAALRSARRFEESTACLERLLRITPNSPMAHNSLGLTHSDAGKLEQATEEFRIAIRLDPKYGPAHTYLGKTLGQRGQPDEVLGELQLGAQLAPQRFDSRTALALALQERGRLDEAIGEFEEAIRLRPADALARSDLGFALQAAGRSAEAIEQCELALNLDPKEARAHLNLGLALQDKGRVDEAIDHFRQAALLDPREPKAFNNLGRALSAKGLHADAIHSYRQAIEIDPTLAVAHSNLGIELAGAGELDAATTEFQKAVELDPKLASSRANLASALLQAGRFSEAQPEIQLWIELAPEGSSLHRGGLETLRSCENLLALDRRMPRILARSDEPADGGECLDLAFICRARRQYATAARFSSDAFERSPELAEDLRSSARYNASCYAALAGCGQGTDALDLGEEERAGWRAQALEWLRTDLSSRVRYLDEGPAGMRAAVIKSLPNWQQDPDLACVREEPSVALLPAPEQGEWRALWNDVDQAIQRIRNSK